MKTDKSLTWTQSRKYGRIFRIIDSLIAERERITVVIEGNSAAGKSSLAALLASVYDCNLFHMDDFFLPQVLKLPGRLAQPGGNVDHERFKIEIADKLSSNESFCYQPFSCSTQSLMDPIHVSPKKINIIEGSYSMHPKLGLIPSLSVFLKITPDFQSRRILERNGPVMAQRFMTEWIPLENFYFNTLQIQQRCDLILDNT